MKFCSLTIIGFLVFLVTIETIQAEKKQEIQRLVIAPIKNDEIDKIIIQALEQEILSAVTTFKHIKIIAKDEMFAMLQLAAQKQMFVCEEEDNACLAEMGKMSNADLLLNIGIAQIGKNYLLYLTLIEPTTSDVKGRATAEAPSPSLLLEEVKEAITKTITGESAASVHKYSLTIPPGGLKTAVMPLTPHGINKSIADSLTQVVAQKIKEIDGISVISQDEIQAMLQFESQKQSLGCDSTSCFAEIGGALGVDYLIIGSIGKLESTFMVNLKLIDTQNAQVQNRVNETFKGQEADLIKAVKFTVYNLLGAAFENNGTLTLKTNDDDIDIRMNDQPLELSNGRITIANLLPGRYSFNASADGYFGKYIETYIEPGKTNNVFIELSPMPKKWYKQWWIWTIGTAIIGGLAGGLYFGLTADDGNPTGDVMLSISR